ncbi:hydroxymethylpyrimidine/phosphomethylpyrimidine kinase [Thiohalobacter sp. IOR34]|uniref:bifunctional hydroxymethylpyrimidine kinase/phosphomethylpyrimidine kinase n=1 Tax=Thiohalobacter sp. IOR34 TaxID=3057176 RepID=UPI0025B00ACF|nr:hydroxymethylpyrimidine/phosphomethylpyrimidine kinase [Thiohalobacter sp. IOR34]WJW75230.1 hydroxymethylpyrimidine/phosphomethylpyrimidine kinase [Thiohalobacter sp. IOR34]
MNHAPSKVPVVLALSGNDPSGGAGIEADIEALASHGCHCAPVITSLTVQDTRDIQSLSPLDGLLVAEQARAVLEDMPVAAIKIGLLGSADIIENVSAILEDYPDIPVVLDPVLATGAGTGLVDDETLEAMDSLLLPHATVLTPNSIEARILSPEADNLDACAMSLLERGCEFVLITGTHENTEHVVNRLYGNHRLLESFTWERLPASYHGSGCTLAASTAGLLAQGLEPFTALHEAQEYTWEALKHGYQLGMGQALPNRLFWARADQD